MADVSKENPEIMGRKVFFLYPHSVIQNDMVNILINNEYEVYTINDHVKMLEISKKFPQSILFINIDEKLNENQWEKYIKDLLENNDHISRIGILTYNKDQNLAQKYLMELMVPCGFIVLTLSLEQSAATILKTLQANEAKGRRKFLRASGLSSASTKMNFKFNDILYNGSITDISITGMAISIDDDIILPLHAALNDIQLQLKGIICRVNGVVAAHRNGSNGSCVIMFQNLDELSVKKIHNFIYNNLQQKIRKVLSS